MGSKSEKKHDKSTKNRNSKETKKNKKDIKNDEQNKKAKKKPRRKSENNAFVAVLSFHSDPGFAYFCAFFSTHGKTVLPLSDGKGALCISHAFAPTTPCRSNLIIFFRFGFVNDIYRKAVKIFAKADRKRKKRGIIK